MEKKNLSKPFTCPVCPKVKKWGELVKHVAYSGDSKHEQWRIAHHLPGKVPFGTHNKCEPVLRIAVVKNGKQ